MVVNKYVVEYDRDSLSDEESADQDEICFWNPHRAATQVGDDEDSLKIVWWREEGSDWEPANDDKF